MLIAAAGNTDTCALGELRALDYAVARRGADYRAERPDCTLLASDPLQLLGLACLVERRGADACHPTDAEVAAMLTLDGAG